MTYPWSVSYTHLDVYKRQLYTITDGKMVGLAEALAAGQSAAIYDVCLKTMGKVCLLYTSKEGREQFLLYVKQADRDYARYCTGWRPGGMM